MLKSFINSISRFECPCVYCCGHTEISKVLPNKWLFFLLLAHLSLLEPSGPKTLRIFRILSWPPLHPTPSKPSCQLLASKHYPHLWFWNPRFGGLTWCAWCLNLWGSRKTDFIWLSGSQYTWLSQLGISHSCFCPVELVPISNLLSPPQPITPTCMCGVDQKSESG